jgi:hypothetical protein
MRINGEDASYPNEPDMEVLMGAAVETGGGFNE